MIKKALALAMMVGVVSLFVVGCSGGSDAGGTTTGTTASAPATTAAAPATTAAAPATTAPAAGTAGTAGTTSTGG